MRTKFFVLAAPILLAACQASTNLEGDATSSASSEAMSSESAMMDESPFAREEVSIDEENSTLTFEGQSNIINHEGTFEEFDVTLTLDETNPSDLTLATIEATIDMTSAKTDPGVEGHLQRTDFFDTENYPTSTFKSTSIVSNGGNDYTITGDLTVKGKTESISFPATISNGGMWFTYEINRKTFTIGNDSYGDKFLTETVPVEASIVFEEESDDSMMMDQSTSSAAADAMEADESMMVE